MQLHLNLPVSYVPSVRRRRTLVVAPSVPVLASSSAHCRNPPPGLESPFSQTHSSSLSSPNFPFILCVYLFGHENNLRVPLPSYRLPTTRGTSLLALDQLQSCGHIHSVVRLPSLVYLCPLMLPSKHVHPVDRSTSHWSTSN